PRGGGAPRLELRRRGRLGRSRTDKTCDEHRDHGSAHRAPQRPPPPCGGGTGRGVTADTELASTPLPPPPPQGGREQTAAAARLPPTRRWPPTRSEPNHR